MIEKETESLYNLFLRDKPAKILLALKSAKTPVYATILSKESNCTYSHTVKILNTLESLGIVKLEKKGRIKGVQLTSDGWDIAHNLEAMSKKFAQIEENLKKQKQEAKKKPEKKEEKQ
jgi:predicted transcriptional regulator